MKKEMLFNSSRLKSQVIKVMKKMSTFLFYFYCLLSEKGGSNTYNVPQKKGRLDIKLFRNNFHKTFSGKVFAKPFLGKNKSQLYS